MRILICCSYFSNVGSLLWVTQNSRAVVGVCLSTVPAGRVIDGANVGGGKEKNVESK